MTYQASKQEIDQSINQSSKQKDTFHCWPYMVGFIKACLNNTKNKTYSEIHGLVFSSSTNTAASEHTIYYGVLVENGNLFKTNKGL